MKKQDKLNIQNRCKDMANNFTHKKFNENDLFEFGNALNNARYELHKAEYLASKMFYKSKDEYKIVEELFELLDEYRNYMDGKPIETMLPNADSHTLNSVFYGSRHLNDTYVETVKESTDNVEVLGTPMDKELAKELLAELEGL